VTGNRGKLSETTGGFEGTMGKGTLKGERLGSPQTGSDNYIDFIGTEWKKK